MAREEGARAGSVCLDDRLCLGGWHELSSTSGVDGMQCGGRAVAVAVAGGLAHVRVRALVVVARLVVADAGVGVGAVGEAGKRACPR